MSASNDPDKDQDGPAGRTLIDLCDTGLRRATRGAALLAVSGMVAFSLLTIADVSLRAVANRPIPGLYELAELLMACIIVACFPAVLANRKNLTVDFLNSLFSPGMRAGLAAVGGVLATAFIVILAWRFAVHTQGLAARNAVTVTLLLPIAPFWWVVTGILILCVPVQVVATLVQVRDAIRTRRGTTARDAAPMSMLLPERAWAPITWTLVVLSTIAALLLVVPPETAAQVIPDGIGRDGYVVLAFLTLLGLLLLQIPLGVAMGLIGLAATAALLGGFGGGLFSLATNAADMLGSLDLAAIPLFIMMGGFAAAAGISGDVYRLANALFGRFRGGLAMATIGASAGFGAVTGSSVATAATMGRVAMPEMRHRGYSVEMASGSVAAGGTLGMLIPPSAIMILYAVMASTSIAEMYVAAVLPAILAVACYMGAVFVMVRLRPGTAPPGDRAPFTEVLRAALGSWSVIVLFGIVIGGLYLGIFTATEAAAVGAGSAFLFAWARGGFRRGGLWRVLDETASSTGMLYFLVIGATAFSFFIGIARLPSDILAWLKLQDLAPTLVLLLILALYVFLGFFMDPFTSLLVTLPIVLPIIDGFGYDLIWWGILTIMLIEIGMITPPVGLNIFVLKGVEPDIPIRRIFAGVTPFLISDFVRVGILFAIPAIVLWLPSTMR